MDKKTFDYSFSSIKNVSEEINATIIVAPEIQDLKELDFRPLEVLHLRIFLME